MTRSFRLGAAVAALLALSLAVPAAPAVAPHRFETRDYADLQAADAPLPPLAPYNAAAALAGCDLTVTGRIVAGGLPLKEAPVQIYDRLAGPVDTSATTGTPERNVQDASAQLLATPTTDGDGVFLTCVQASQTLDGTFDLFAKLAAEDGVVSVRAPPNAPDGVRDKNWGSDSVPYVAATREFYHAQGLLDMGAWVPAGPDFYPSPLDTLPVCNIKAASGGQGLFSVTPPSPHGGNALGQLGTLICLPREIVGPGTTSDAFAIYAWIHAAAYHFAHSVGDPISGVALQYPDNSCDAEIGAPGYSCFRRDLNLIRIHEGSAAAWLVMHEYGHKVMADKSADDSRGGVHVLDPSLGWSEGWANFVPDLVLRIATGASDDNATPSSGGQGSESNVRAALDDLFDADNEPGDTATEPFSDFWVVFRQDVPRFRPTSFCGFEQAWASHFAGDAAKIARLVDTAAHNGIVC